MMKKILLFVLFCSVTVIAYGQTTYENVSTTTTASTANVNVSQTITLNLYNVLNVVFTPATGGNTFDFNTAASYDNGITKANAVNFVIKSTKNWQMSVQSLSTNFSNTGATATIPLSIFSLKVNGQTTSYTLSTTAQTVKSGNKGGSSTAGNNFSLDYTVNPGYNYTGDTYTATIQYTFSQL